MLRLLLLAALVAGTASAQSFELLGGYRTDIDDPPFTRLESVGGQFVTPPYGADASTDGRVVFGDIASPGGRQSVLLDGDSLRVVAQGSGNLEYPGRLGDVTRYASISADGSTILGVERAGSSYESFVLWDWRTDEVQRFPVPTGYGGTQALEWAFVSADGSTVGAYFQWQNGGDTERATVRIVGGAVDAVYSGFAAWSMSGDGTTFVGRDLTTSDLRGALVDDEGRHIFFPAGAFGTIFYSANGDGETAVGQAALFSGSGVDTVPLLWSDGEGRLLPLASDLPPAPIAPNASLLSVNGDGTLAVGNQRTTTGDSPILWRAGAGTTSLAAALTDDYGLDLLGFEDDPANGTDFRVGFITAGNVVIGSGRLNGEGGVLWRARLVPQDVEPLVVNSVADRANAAAGGEECDTGQTVTDSEGDERPECTLRAAIQAANARTGRDSIAVRIPGAGLQTITLASSLPALSEPLVFDATTQPGYAGSPLVALTGTQEVGFELAVGGTTVRGVSVGGFSVAGIRISGPGGNRIEASHVGLADGAARPNGTGIVVDGSPYHVLHGNVIAGNSGPGVLITGASAAGVGLTGNRIGTTADGSAALGNGAEGVRVDGAPGVRIGGATEAERNVIAGNGLSGVRVTGEAAGSVTVAGNFIGTDATGARTLPNDGATTTGVVIDGAPGALIGGETEGEGNVIVGSVSIAGPGADGARIQSNRINLSADGRTELDAEAFTGIDVRYASGIRIGGLAASPGQAPGNVIVASGPDASGISVLGEDDPNKGPADDLRILGNLIGTDATGAVAIPVREEGILVRGLVRNARLGEAGGGNLIVTDRDAAIVALDLGGDIGAPDGLAVAGNTIGMSRGGAAVLGDVTDGVRVAGNAFERGVMGVSIGGPGEAGNRIAAEAGVILVGSRTSGATVTNNVIGLLSNGLIAREAAADGITLLLANEVALEGNVVAGFERGIVLASDENVLTRNRVGTNEGGSVSRANEIGIVIPREVTGLGETIPLGNGNEVGAEGAGNVITGNASIGVLIGPSVAFQSGPFLTAGDGRAVVRLTPSDSAALARLARPTEASHEARQRAGGGAAQTLVAFNRIGVNLSGAVLGNGTAGVLIQDGRGTRLLGNTLAGGPFGAVIGATTESERPGETVLAGNTIRDTQVAGLAIQDSDANVLTALPLEEGGNPIGNTFEGNAGAAVRFLLDAPTATGNRVRGATFQRNGGPSILLTTEGGTYPGLAPPPPEVYAAIANGQSATVRFRAGVTGEAEVFASPRCAAGHADGEPMARIAGSSGLSTVAVPITIDAPLLTAYVAATVTTPGEDGTTSAFSTCVRIADKGDVAEAPVAEGETGEVLDDVGIGVTLTQNPGLTRARGTARTARGGGGTLYAMRYGPQLPPQPGPFGGAATAPGGSTVAPDAVASDRYWALRAYGLADVTYDLCLDAAGVGGIENPDRVVVVHRETTGHPWTPLATTREGSRLCASGLTAWGEIGIGAVQAENPVPSEPAPEASPEALAVTAYPNPSRGSAVVRLAVPVSGPVRAAVHDALGREVAVLHDGAMSAGETEMPLPRLAPGVYVVRLSTPTASASAAVTLVR